MSSSNSQNTKPGKFHTPAGFRFSVAKSRTPLATSEREERDKGALSQ